MAAVVKGRPPKFTQAEIDHMRELYFRKDRPLSAATIARLFRCSEGTVLRAASGAMKAKPE